jgi:benzoyl-CoA reductase/2-hydroxyglutaryl-CoA dehydratase subunit BcrC/BadD/HgdB
MENIVALPGRLDVIHSYKEQGGSIAAVFPIHYSRALFRAFNLLPVEVWGPPGVDASKGTSHLQPYVCSIVHSALAFLQSGGLDIVDLLVVPHACDSLQGFGSILIDFIRPRQAVLPIYLPRGRRASDLEFLSRELHSAFERLQEITGIEPSNEDLTRCIQREEAADVLLAELHAKRERLNVNAFRSLISNSIAWSVAVNISLQKPSSG